MLLLQLRWGQATGKVGKVGKVRVESPAVAADRPYRWLVQPWWVSRDELQPAGEATGFRRAGMRIFVLTSPLLQCVRTLSPGTDRLPMQLASQVQH